MIEWSKKLNVISDNLPRGVWIRKLTLRDDRFLIDASSISRDQQELINASRFLSTLKEKELFVEQLEDLELGPMIKRNIKNIEVTDFLITSSLEEQEKDG